MERYSVEERRLSRLSSCFFLLLFYFFFLISKWFIFSSFLVYGSAIPIIGRLWMRPCLNESRSLKGGSLTWWNKSRNKNDRKLPFEEHEK